MDYLADGKKHSLSYQSLREDYHRYVDMPDNEFLLNLTRALHFACFVCYLKEIPSHACLIDTGIIHELIHLLDENTQSETLLELPRIRETFKNVCRLA